MNQLTVNVEVESAFVESRSGVSAKGKDYEIHSQKVWVYLGSKFPKEMVLNLESPKDAYRPGLYVVDLLPALDIGDFGRLQIDGRKLQLIDAPAKVKAA